MTMLIQAKREAASTNWSLSTGAFLADWRVGMVVHAFANMMRGLASSAAAVIFVLP